MGMFYNFENVELVRIGEGKAHITKVGACRIDYVDEAGAKKTIDLKECARTFEALQHAGAFPPSEDTHWSAIADAQPHKEQVGDTIGLRARMDEPPWFQFLNRRRTQFQFHDAEEMSVLLMTPLIASVYGGSWDAS